MQGTPGLLFGAYVPEREFKIRPCFLDADFGWDVPPNPSSAD
jgi:hypothetical protein